MQFQKNTSVGIDISDSTIEVVKIVNENTGLKIASIGRMSLALGVVERGRIKDKTQLTAALKKVLAAATPDPIREKSFVFGLPESQTYTHLFDLKPHKASERDFLIRKEAAASIPLEENQIAFSYSILDENAKGARVLLVAVSKDIFAEWITFFQDAGFDIECFDIEALAIFRGLFAERPASTKCIVDIGAASTTISIFDAKGLQYSYETTIAGDAMTAEIAKQLDIPLDKAEAQKIAVGLSDKNGKMYAILTQLLQPILDGITSSMRYIQNKTGNEVKEIVLVGASSKLKGLLPYIKEQFHQPIQIGRNNALEYVEAIGLALRGFRRDQDKNDPLILPRIPARESVLSGAITLEKKEEEEETNGIRMALPREIAFTQKFQFEKKLFILILIAGVFMIAGAFWVHRHFSGPSGGSQQSGPSASPPPYKPLTTYVFDAKIPLVIGSSAKMKGSVQGRIITDQIDTEDYEKEDVLIIRSRDHATLALRPGEALWKEPIIVSAAPSPSAVPSPKAKQGSTATTTAGIKASRTYQWLAYPEQEANTLLEQDAKQYHAFQRYAVDSVEKKSLISTEDPKLFYLAAKVSISLKENTGAGSQ